MLKRLIQGTLNRAGFELRRKGDSNLPFIHTIHCGKDRFPFWIANAHTQAWWCKPEVSETAETTSLKRMCPPGSVVLEVGAHHGFYSVLLALWTGPDGQVHTFEANAGNALVLNANINLNRLQNCHAQFAAVGSRRGTLQVLGESVTGNGKQGRAVTQISLDDYIREKGISRVDLLKIDVEGFEAEVLRGCKYLLENRPAISLELHLDDLQQFGESAQRVLQLLPVDQYVGDMMIRPNWHQLTTFKGLESLPSGGVVNLFLYPREGACK